MKKKLCDEYERNRDSKQKIMRETSSHELEQALVNWICVVRENNIAIIGPMVQEKALEFATASGVQDFVASMGWLDRFKRRKNHDFKTNLYDFFHKTVTRLQMDQC